MINVNSHNVTHKTYSVSHTTQKHTQALCHGYVVEYMVFGYINTTLPQTSQPLLL